MKNYMRYLVVASIVATLANGTLYAAEKSDVASSLDADVVTYDMKTGLMTATGNVLMTHGDAKLTGKYAEMNDKTQEGKVVGDVIIVQRDTRITADICRTEGKDHMVAEGNVNATKADKTYSGPRVDYFQKDEYMLMEQGGTITSTSGDIFVADRMEGWQKTKYSKGTGHAYLKSPQRDMEAKGDVIEYFGRQEGATEPPKALLTGNAWVRQDNNTLRSNHLTLIIDDTENNQEVKVSE